MTQRTNANEQRSLTRKFRDAMRGTKRGVRSESNFFVHFFIAAAVIAAAVVLGASRLEWCLLLLCIAAVLAAEMFNCAIEHLARAITEEHSPQIRDALDISSAGVLMTVFGSGAVGLVVFIYRLGLLLAWWAPS